MGKTTDDWMFSWAHRSWFRGEAHLYSPPLQDERPATVTAKQHFMDLLVHRPDFFNWRPVNWSKRGGLDDEFEADEEVDSLDFLFGNTPGAGELSLYEEGDEDPEEDEDNCNGGSSMMVSRPVPQKTFGQMLRLEIERASGENTSIKKLAEKCRVSQDDIIAWRNDEYYPTNQQLSRLTRVFTRLKFSVGLMPPERARKTAPDPKQRVSHVEVKAVPPAPAPVVAPPPPPPPVPETKPEPVEVAIKPEKTLVSGTKPPELIEALKEVEKPKTEPINTNAVEAKPASTPTYVCFREALASEREKTGTPKVDLAAVLEVTSQRISFWEIGSAKPTVEQYNQLVQLLPGLANAPKPPWGRSLEQQKKDEKLAKKAQTEAPKPEPVSSLPAKKLPPKLTVVPREQMRVEEPTPPTPVRKRVIDLSVPEPMFTPPRPRVVEPSNPNTLRAPLGAIAGKSPAEVKIALYQKEDVKKWTKSVGQTVKSKDLPSFLEMLQLAKKMGMTIDDVVASLKDD